VNVCRRSRPETLPAAAAALPLKLQVPSLQAGYKPGPLARPAASTGSLVGWILVDDFG